jgi:hypothetical protein
VSRACVGARLSAWRAPTTNDDVLLDVAIFMHGTASDRNLGDATASPWFAEDERVLDSAIVRAADVAEEVMNCLNLLNVEDYNRTRSELHADNLVSTTREPRKP